jgi:hypothetical protein
MEFDIKVQNLADLLLNWAVSSTKEVDMDCLWYPLGTSELLEKLSTDVYWLFTNNEVFIYDTVILVVIFLC